MSEQPPIASETAPAPEAADAAGAPTAAAVTPRPFDGSDLVVAEFNYIAQTAFQANEDRARVSQLFFATFGTVIAATLSSRLLPEEVNLRQVYIAYTVLFLVLGAIGVLTLLQLVRLREAWRSSIDALNQMKRRMQAADPGAGKLFVWGVENETQAPPLYKAWSVGFMLAVIVALLTGMPAGAAYACWNLANETPIGQGTVAWGPTVSIGVGTAIALLALHRYLLTRERD